MNVGGQLRASKLENQRSWEKGCVTGQGIKEQGSAGQPGYMGVQQSEGPTPTQLMCENGNRQELESPMSE